MQQEATDTIQHQETLVNITIRVLEKDFTIKCPPDKVHELRESASYLDNAMRKIRQSGKVVGSDRIAILAALNITHELLHNDSEGPISAYNNALSLRFDALLERLQTTVENCS